MSALGDYVHYTAYGYNVYGINRIGEGFAGDKVLILNKARQLQKKNTINLSSSDKSDIENTISSFMTSTPQGEDKNFMEWLFQKLGIQFVETMPYLITESSGNVETKIKQVKTDTKYTKESTIINRLQDITNAVQYLQKEVDKGTVGQGKLEALIDVKNNLEDKIKIFFNAAQVYQNNAGYGIYKDLDFKGFKESIRMDILKLINQASVITQGLSNMKKGTFFQLQAAYALAKAQGVGYEQFLKKINNKEIWTGQNTSQVKIYLKTLSFKETEDEIKRIQKILGDNYKYDVNQRVFKTKTVSPNKIDFIVNWNGQDLKISAKNINLFNKFDVSLVDKVSAISLMQAMDSNFVNHYLNIISAHRSGPREGSPYQSLRNIDILQTSARMAMKINLLLSALEGHKLGVDKANVFIVNNNKPSGGKRVRVFTIQELIGAALRNVESSVVIQTNRGDLDSFTIVNSFQNSVTERLQNVQAALHGWTITVKLNKETLQSIF